MTKQNCQIKNRVIHKYWQEEREKIDTWAWIYCGEKLRIRSIHGSHLGLSLSLWSSLKSLQKWLLVQISQLFFLTLLAIKTCFQHCLCLEEDVGKMPTPVIITLKCMPLLKWLPMNRNQIEPLHSGSDQMGSKRVFEAVPGQHVIAIIKWQYPHTPNS